MKQVSKAQLSKNIKEFEKAVFFFQKYYGLLQWELHVIEAPKDDSKNRASVSWNISGRIASVFYGHDWIRDPEVKKEEIAKVAFHEIAELMQYDAYENLGKQRGWEFAQEQTHIVIRFLENKFWKYTYREYLKNGK